MTVQTAPAAVLADVTAASQNLQEICFGIKMAVAGAFTQAKTSTNNFPKNSRKTAKVNSLP
ncbi:MAG: hypothetical protein ACYTXC_17890 [Nostoc sp.]